MRRNVFLLVILLITVLSRYYVTDLTEFSQNHLQAIVASNNLVDTDIVSDDDKNKLPLIPLIEVLNLGLIVLILFRVTQTFYLDRRLRFINPIFYQGNYLDNSLLNLSGK